MPDTASPPLCAGWQKWNGAANIARMIMDEQRREGHEVSFVIWAKVRELRAADEVTDVKRFFKLTDCKIDRLIDHRIDRSGDYGADDFKQSVNPTIRQSVNSPLHILYLGRRHPLKGVEYLEAAVAELNSNPVNPVNPVQKASTRPELEFRIVSNAFGEELEKVWAWCDVLVLPTLSENFGLVVAEALERGKRVITTDGAPAWGDGNDYGGRLAYLKGYRDGTTDERVGLLKSAIASLASGSKMVWRKR